MHNDLYPDMVIGCLKARVVPVNVNHHYSPREIAELLDYVRPRASSTIARWERGSLICCRQRGRPPGVHRRRERRRRTSRCGLTG
ncbi:fatty-acid-CoA ligase domain protein [Mycobacterium ulcerans str. Harvey]|uniref:Fatty-acid-CoA ligase domain protein n=1 Tax=Mycobacterium ulcerans str. Harvey TaxID=1299332 RepID=A0ABN0QRD1_MYCUL|nr:fatty-acid-CoA ligase domain protein [Mycobacterium ulcerans str. Harvey]